MAHREEQRIDAAVAQAQHHDGLDFERRKQRVEVVGHHLERQREIESYWLSVAGPPRSVCEPLFGEEVLALRDPPVRAVWITAGNPVTMLPDSEKIARALRTRHGLRAPVDEDSFRRAITMDLQEAIGSFISPPRTSGFELAGRRTARSIVRRTAMTR